MKKQNQSQTTYSGFSLVEALLSIAIFSATAVIIINTMIYVQDSNIAAANLQRATKLAAEAIEISQGLQNENFSILTNGNYRLTVNSGKYVLSTGVETINGFNREIIIDSTGLDTYEKRVTSRVTWYNRVGGLKTVENQAILSDWQRVIVQGWTNPTVATVIDTPGTQNIVDLEIEGNFLYILQDNGSFLVYSLANPNSPTFVNSTTMSTGTFRFSNDLNLFAIASSSNTQEMGIIQHNATPTLLQSFNLNGNSDAINTKLTPTRLYVLRSYAGNLPAIPPATQEYSLSIYSRSGTTFTLVGNSLLSTRTISTFAIYGDYAYIGSNRSLEEIAIVNATNASAPVILTGINLPGNNSIQAMTTYGTTLFVASSNSLIYVYSLANPAVPSLITSISVPANVYAIKAEDNKLFIVTRTTGSQFRVIDITTIGSPVNLATLSIADTFYDVEYSTALNRVYLGSSGNNTELRVITP